MTSAAGTVNEGTETFTILSGTTVIGSAVTVNVDERRGQRQLRSCPPALRQAPTPSEAVYNGTANFLGFTDTSHSLTVSPAATSTAAASTSATFSPASQTVPSTPRDQRGRHGQRGHGDLHDPERHDGHRLGRHRQCRGGTASASYVLPAGTSAGTYTIQAVYNGTADFLGSTDTSHSLTSARRPRPPPPPAPRLTFSLAGQTVLSMPR